MKKILTLCFLFSLLFLSCTDREERPRPCIPNPADSNITENIEVENIFDTLDSYFRFQGYLHYSGKYGLAEWERQAAIDILPAWAITKGAGVRIAVFDDNIQANHEDLKGITVWNVRDGSNSVEPEPDSLGNMYSHGLAVSGLIAAQKNGIGIIGIAPESDLLFIGDGVGEFSDADIVKAFEHARNWGARIISCSWGSYNASQSFENLVKSFYNQGITIVFAAGNDGLNMDTDRYRGRPINDESELPWVIGVSASNSRGVLTTRESGSFWSSNFGSNIDIMAPGDRILTLDLMGFSDGNGLTGTNYAFESGTSFSAPIVAGVVALMLSANPNLTPSEIRQIIFDTARKNPVEIRGGRYDSNCFSLHHAHGLINAGRAVRAAAGLDE